MQLRGVLRINGNKSGIRLLLSRVVPRFDALYPQVELDLITDGALVDIVQARLRRGRSLGRGGPSGHGARSVGATGAVLAVASPGYLASHPAITTPKCLQAHRCIRQRLPSGKRYRWELAKDGKAVAIDVAGQITLNDNMLMVEAAMDGLGIAYVPEVYAANPLAAGTLAAVLTEWCP